MIFRRKSHHCVVRKRKLFRRFPKWCPNSHTRLVKRANLFPPLCKRLMSWQKLHRPLPRRILRGNQPASAWIRLLWFQSSSQPVITTRMAVMCNSLMICCVENVPHFWETCTIHLSNDVAAARCGFINGVIRVLVTIASTASAHANDNYLMWMNAISGIPSWPKTFIACLERWNAPLRGRWNMLKSFFWDNVQRFPIVVL